MLFIPNQFYHRQRDIHDRYGGQSGAISIPPTTPCIFLFTSDTHGTRSAADGWISNDTFLYTGEGLLGDMTFGGTNGAVRDHLINRKDIYLFEGMSDRPGIVRAIGQMLLTGWQYRQQNDVTGKLRQAIVFELTFLASLDGAPAAGDGAEPTIEELMLRPLAELRVAALADPAAAHDLAARIRHARLRSRAITAYALVRANGRCEGCGQAAPFSPISGLPRLEVHHIGRLSDGGPDRPEYVAAVCPACHQRAHAGADVVPFTTSLQTHVRQHEDLVAA
jgi:5-methylcytosine-specific restriction protein A